MDPKEVARLMEEVMELQRMVVERSRRDDPEMLNNAMAKLDDYVRLRTERLQELNKLDRTYNSFDELYQGNPGVARALPAPVTPEMYEQSIGATPGSPVTNQGDTSGPLIGPQGGIRQWIMREDEKATLGDLVRKPLRILVDPDARREAANFISSMGQGFIPFGDEVAGVVAAVNPFDDKGFSEGRRQNLARQATHEYLDPESAFEAKTLATIPQTALPSGALRGAANVVRGGINLARGGNTANILGGAARMPLSKFKNLAQMGRGPIGTRRVMESTGFMGRSAQPWLWSPGAKTGFTIGASAGAFDQPNPFYDEQPSSRAQGAFNQTAKTLGYGLGGAAVRGPVMGAGRWAAQNIPYLAKRYGLRSSGL